MRDAKDSLFVFDTASLRHYNFGAMKNPTGGEIYIAGVFVLVGSILLIASLTHLLLNP